MKTKRITAIIGTFIICFSVLTMAFADESAEIPDGYTPIYKAEDLYNIRNDLDGKYILTNDIDLSVYENWEPIGSSETPFTGEFDGNGYTIRNMNIISYGMESENDLGLFGVVQNGVLKKIIIENGNISATHTDKTDAPALSVGMIVGKAIGDDYMKTTNCFSDGKIDINGFANVSVGGLIGSALNDNYVGLCVNNTDININTQNYNQKIFAGGILGRTSYDIDLYEESFFNIKTSANYGNILINNDVCSEETQIYAGGISSYQITGNNLSDCYNRGNISAQKSIGYLVFGGIIGEAIARVENSYNAGKIIVPSDNNDKISSVCNIKTPYLYAPEGPMMAKDYIVYNCYYLDDCLIPCYQDSDIPYKWFYNIVTLSDAEMKTQSSFVGFDFEEIWKMEENGYPVLQNQPEMPESIPEDPTTESTTESTTEPETEPSTEPSDNECPLANLWIIKAINWLLDSVWNAVAYILAMVS